MIFEGSLEPEDYRGVLWLSFEVPKTVRDLTLSFEYSPQVVGNLRNEINLLFYDPLGHFRGRHQGREGRMVIGDDPSHGVVSGPIVPGTWRMAVEIHSIFTKTVYRVEVDLGEELETKWFVGELHSHSVHSDGEMSVEELGDLFRRKGLDFFFITDHSNVSGWRDLERLEGIVGFPGIEVNTFKGHVLVLGARAFVEWKGRDIREIRDFARNVGGIVGVAHPDLPPDPLCAGCSWEYEHTFEMDFVEVWSSNAGRLNDVTIAKWIRALRSGGKVAGTSGNDVHRVEDYSDPMKYFVKVGDMRLLSVLEGIKSGRSILSKVDRFSLDVSGANPGEELLWSEFPILHFTGEGMKRVSVVTEKEVRSFDSNELEVKLDWIEAEDFVLIQGYGKNDELLFLSNPVFLRRRG